MMEALWVQQWHNRVDQALLKRMLRSSEPWARAAATRVLCYWRDRVPDAMALLDAQVKDAHPGRAARGRPRRQLLPDARRRAHRQDGREGSAGQVPGLRLSAVADHARRTGEEEHDDGDTAPAEANTTATALPDLSAASMRRDLRDKGVQTIAIGTVPEQMMFDVRWFVVEAGKPVQLTLTNSDFMPHNIVVGAPGLDQSDRHGGRDHAGAERA